MTKLDEKDRGALDRMVAELEEQHGDALLAVLLTGEAASADYRPGKTRLTTLVLLSEVTAEALRRTRGSLKAWGKRRIATPLFMDPLYVESACDVFPIELLEISDRHLLLYGESDPSDALLAAVEAPARVARVVALALAEACDALGGADCSSTTSGQPGCCSRAPAARTSKRGVHRERSTSDPMGRRSPLLAQQVEPEQHALARGAVDLAALQGLEDGTPRSRPSEWAATRPPCIEEGGVPLGLAGGDGAPRVTGRERWERLAGPPRPGPAPGSPYASRPPCPGGRTPCSRYRPGHSGCRWTP